MSGGDMAKPLLGHRSTEGDPSVVPAAGRTIGVLGSGDFARSLAIRLVCSGFKVVVGSRNPKRKACLFPPAAEVTFQAEAVKKTDVIFVAVFREHYSTLCDLADVLAGKILVDVSNNTEINHHKESNAEYLASLFPACTVVKGFNVVSAWTLQSGARDGNKQVLICSNSQEAKRTVAEIAQVMGFTPVDMGCMSSAREIENIPLRLLPAWKIPIFLALGLFLCFFTYNLVRQVIHPYIREQKNKFYKIPVEVVNTTLPCVAYVMLSLVYLPGVLAACLQLYYGTKYRRFPDWLDQWLQHRKQIGLLSFFCAALHAVYSLCLPMRRSHRYQLIETAVKQAMEKKMTIWVEEEVWRMEIYISVGIIALGLLSLLAITSLPSIANSLNWREFSFIQSTLGFIALVISTLHTLTYGWSRAFDENQYKFYLPPTYTLTLLVPCTVILAKVAFSLPCIQHRLLRIRRGWEKGRSTDFLGFLTAKTSCFLSVWINLSTEL
ncbi:metalloreductase STEAP3 isoform X1 [Gallus gallus]|uniref:STEAP3 metalloreductase n=1 Tax=Gallus gallus TaxID=9031 RepID=E1BXD1_CHICK|nr:metalloreductase STEAP3 isoform X1 [Gallus gallus]XP_040531631.1 metalloreductase STEAP3 isoform X1 [Gallus gallus]XP_040531632.1 metalloreductase STEAP3 isoform X1 [Gallus gallus]XP_040531633.1 metalloreductase STEAP3 isoform X1 [Gallus gallus]XP_040531635.1 metalloreductase STEAP3 isoform X1 [Gallus gallus]XP_040559588.1 metalloreductase STEAP3 isoform X1 [Gallus gallus]XP_040559589.1 metalloreductase STEAP3 isoform X1 [Gallus gallus]XP_040559590.1 metalloreductase STEAP3 isoform X1 [Ga